MLVVDRKRRIEYKPEVFGNNSAHVELLLMDKTDKYEVYRLRIPQNYTDSPLSIKWKLKNTKVKGSWTSGNILDKRFRTDWEMPQLNASISVDAPIIGLFDEDDNNVQTIACSETVHELSFECSLREEDNHFYCAIHFFTKIHSEKDYETYLLLNREEKNFSQVIKQASSWIVEKANLNTNSVPALAKKPLYSTWYSFHQDLREEELLEELKISKAYGYELVIIDDGWQTLDDNRGYDYTGDWQPDRFPDMRQFIANIHETGMAAMLWYSVPFCGVKSKAYQKFKGKFLTENHHWAPVFDPRFPDVRAYLVGIYTKALLDWNLDGFKLDFIDDFKIYPETEMKDLNGRDTLSVAKGVDLLIDDIKAALKSIKEDVLIEFRQKYIGPGLRKLGNMFRAFDCPNDSLMNRVRTTDIKLICGETAVHSDMLTWSKDADVEYAALQFTSILFSVPQISVMLNERSKEEHSMIQFYTNYWNDNAALLMDGNFIAYKPLANYPLLSSSNQSKIIYGLYDDLNFDLNSSFKNIDVVNGKMSDDVVFKSSESFYAKILIKNCSGKVIDDRSIKIINGVNHVSCPPNGIIFLQKI